MQKSFNHETHEKYEIRIGRKDETSFVNHVEISALNYESIDFSVCPVFSFVSCVSGISCLSSSSEIGLRAKTAPCVSVVNTLFRNEKKAVLHV